MGNKKRERLSKPTTTHLRSKTANVLRLTLVNNPCLLPPHLLLRSWVYLFIRPLCYSISSHVFFLRFSLPDSLILKTDLKKIYSLYLSLL
ncbi:unnamed protein product [Brassica oleracea var. botrytis]